MKDWPISIQLWWMRSIAHWNVLLKRNERAELIWRDILALHLKYQRNPGHVYGTLAHFAASRQDRASAQEMLEKSIEHEPEQSRSWFNLGFTLQEQEQHEQALTMFQRAIELDEKNDRAWYGKAISLIKLHRNEEAIPLLKKNIELQPMSPFGFYQLAHVHFRLGQRDKAERLIRQVSRFEPQVSKQLQRETGIVIESLV